MNDMITDRPITVTPICLNPAEHKIVKRLKKLMGEGDFYERQGVIREGESRTELIFRLKKKLGLIQKILGEEK